MDFSAAQDQARRTSKKLVLLFVISVISLIVITNILVAVTLLGFDVNLGGDHRAAQSALDPVARQANNIVAQLTDYLSLRRFFLISLAVCGVVGCAIVYKWVQLSGGGKRVAEQLGGHRIQPNTNDANEKRVLNVVEEMAIASGMPVPAVYLLANEAGINAFAAGNTPADAVVGVTRGAVEQFDRDQLQGVIAHEFSHILNGDMRINIRLIAILHGIVFIGLVGEVLLHSGSGRRYGGSNRRGKGNQLALLGLGLLAVGWLGRFFGNWIKSAVSRQREYLADASAVQFTRNPQGLADALKIIGGYSPGAQLQSTQAGEMRHLFFGSVIKKVSGFFATHPPLDQRISLIQPSWNGQYITRSVKKSGHDIDTDKAAQKDKRADIVLGAVIAAGAAAQAMVNGESLETIRADIEAIPVSIQNQIKEPFGAMAIVYGILLSRDATVCQRQLEGIAFSSSNGNIKGLLELTKQLQTEVLALERGQHLPIVELALPALKCLSPPQYKVFRKTLLLLVRADQKLDLFEWCVFELLCHYLDPEFGKVKTGKPLYRHASQVADEYTIVLSTLFHFGKAQDGAVNDDRAFSRGLNTAGLYSQELLAKELCTLDKFTAAVDTLAAAYPLLKPRLLKGLSDCALHDNHISPVEREMISAIAAIMDCPLPVLSL